MNTYEQIRKDLKEAMKARDSLTSSVLRGLLSAFTNELVAQKKKPTDRLSEEEIIRVIKRATKQRKDSITQFKQAGRDDLATKEDSELEVLKKYLPAEATEEEVKQILKQKKDELQISDKSKIGILIGATMKELAGRADGSLVKELAQELLD